MKAWTTAHAFTTLLLGVVLTLGGWAVLGWGVFGGWYPKTGTTTFTLRLMRGTGVDETLRQVCALPEPLRSRLIRDAFWSAYGTWRRESTPFELQHIAVEFQPLPAPIEVGPADIEPDSNADTAPYGDTRGAL